MITIIGILIALLLPAVQAAREAARRLQCSNNLKQLSLGCLGHENTYGFLPSGGWTSNWFGDPDRGVGKKQPGGWCYSVLPYVEQQALHDIGSGHSTDAEIAAANARRFPTTVATFYCPTRRPAMAYPGPCGPARYYGAIPGGLNAKTCYAANFGDFDGRINRGGDSTVFTIPQPPTGYEQVDPPANFPWAFTADITGVCFQRSEVTMAMISDGSSNTYLLGEKFINPDYYLTGQDWGDDWNMYVGQQDDIVRSVGYKTSDNPLTYVCFPPIQDQPGAAGMVYRSSFGSAHAGGLHMSFCDGSVQWINYTIDPEAHRRLGNRQDGQAIDGKKL